MTMKNYAKIEEELTCQLQIDMNLTNIDPSTQKSQTLYFNVLLLTTVCNVRVKNSIDEVCFLALKIDEKFEEKLTCTF